MNIAEIEKMWAEDSIIDPDNLHLESIKIPVLHSKYFNLYNNLVLLKKREDNNFVQLYKDKWLYYQGKSTSEVYKKDPFDHKVIKQDLDKFINSDEDIIKSNTKIEYYSMMIKFLESIIKNIENRSFSIKNAIEFMKFTAGYS
jgi:hypothetical protein